MTATLDIHQAAALLGRSGDWLGKHYGELVRNDGFPPPVLPRGPLTWSKMHVEAWLDRGLAKDLKREVAALRLAEAALRGACADKVAVEAWREHLDQRFRRVEGDHS
jgi:hypothetical protein